MNYRMDHRSKDEFKKDIKMAHAIELDILNRWLNLIKKETGIRPKYQDNAPRNDGEYLADRQVTTDADYIVEGYGLLEIKFSKPLLKDFFHLKQNQVLSYLRQQCILLMVSGINTENPVWTLIYPVDLIRLISLGECHEVKWFSAGFKEAYKIPVNEFEWRSLNEI